MLTCCTHVTMCCAHVRRAAAGIMGDSRGAAVAEHAGAVGQQPVRQPAAGVGRQRDVLREAAHPGCAPERPLRLPARPMGARLQGALACGALWVVASDVQRTVSSGFWPTEHRLLDEQHVRWGGAWAWGLKITVQTWMKSLWTFPSRTEGKGSMSPRKMMPQIAYLFSLENMCAACHQPWVTGSNCHDLCRECNLLLLRLQLPHWQDTAACCQWGGLLETCCVCVCRAWRCWSCRRTTSSGSCPWAGLLWAASLRSAGSTCGRTPSPAPSQPPGATGMRCPPSNHCAPPTPPQSSSCLMISISTLVQQPGLTTTCQVQAQSHV